MAVVGDFLVGKALESLYCCVEKLIADNLRFESFSTDIKAKLDALRPMIQQMVQGKQPDCPEDPVLRDLRVLMEEGQLVFCECYSKIPFWNFYKKKEYTDKLRKLNEALEKQLILLDVRVAVVADENNGMLHEILDILNPNKSAGIEDRCAPPELPSLIVGLDIPLKELKTQFFKDEVSLLVLTAAGGCGKTTLATKFCQDQDVKDKFKGNIFFVTVSKKPTLELIMTELYKQKGYPVPTFQNGVFPVKWLEKFVEKEGQDKPLLLVLDDVWPGSESLLVKFEFKMSNYKILVTSRSVFPRFGPSYHLQLLDDDNAMQLFHHTASLKENGSRILKDLAKQIVEHCKGFPLAITVVGRSLCGQPIETWRSRGKEWSKGAPVLGCEKELLQCLQCSFDALDNATPKVKECFLDLGAFPEDAKIQVTALIDMWAELYDLDEETTCIAKLIELHNRNLALLQKPERRLQNLEVAVPEDIDYSGYVVRQHDLLRELAIYNTKMKPDQREQRERLVIEQWEQRERLVIEICGNKFPKWWREQKYSYMNARLVSISTDGEFSVKFPNMELPEAEVLVLNVQSKTYALPEFVKRMDKLKMLLVTNYSSLCEELDNFQLLGSSSNLRSIRLDGFDFSCMTKSPVQLLNVHKLYLRGGKCVGKSPPKLSHVYDVFLNLMEMVIEKCKLYLRGGVGKSPTKLSHVFPNLKEMVIEKCKFLESPDELYELIHLTKLTLASCQLSVLSEAIGNLISLEVLTLKFLLEIPVVPDSIVNLKKLRFLNISVCWTIKRLPEHMGKLQCLTHLIITFLYSLKVLPESIGNLVNLEVLSLRGCMNLSELPESIRNLRKLNFLDISGCERIGKLPEHIGELKSLRKLEMVFCGLRKKLPKSVSELEKLEEVVCDKGCGRELWKPFLRTLRNLRIVVSSQSRWYDS